MVLRSIKKMIQSHKQAGPHQRMPEKYFKSVYLPKNIYEDVVMIAELEKKNVRQTVISLLEYSIKEYMIPRMEEERRTRRLMQKGVIPYKPPGAFVKLMRKYMDEHGIKNPRIDKGYRAF